MESEGTLPGLDPLRLQELKATGRLPSPQGVALKVVHLTRRDDVDLADITTVVRADPALTARLLKAANAPALGLSRPIVSVRDALLVLGLPTTRQLVLGFSLISQYREGVCTEFDYVGFWRHAVLTALATQAIAARLRVMAADEAFVCGLLAGVGRLALTTLYPQEYGEVLRAAAAAASDALTLLEQQAFATDHLELAGALLQDWGLPLVHSQAVGVHDAPERANLPENARALHLARALCLANALAVGVTPTGEPAQAATRLGLDQDACDEIATRIANEASEWFRLLDLPEASAAAPSAKVASAPVVQAAEGPLRILLVDDDPDVIEDLKRLLAPEGHTLFVARDGREGLQVAFRASPHLVISDWSMPGMNGVQFCRALRETEFGRSIYVLLLTGFDEEEKMVQAFSAGADDFVVKPVRPRALSARLSAAVRALRERSAREQDAEQMRRVATELAVTNRRLMQEAMTDTLTGQPNRRYAFERLEQEWTQARRSGHVLACLLVDVDHFKRVNDAYGHDVGDAVLRHVATLLREVSPEHDAVCRVGGEQFLVLCPDADAPLARTLAERLRRHVRAAPLVVDGVCLHATVSIGVASSDEPVSGTAELLKRADAALLQAKQAGRDRVKLWQADVSA